MRIVFVIYFALDNVHQCPSMHVHDLELLEHAVRSVGAHKANLWPMGSAMLRLWSSWRGLCMQWPASPCPRLNHVIIVLCTVLVIEECSTATMKLLICLAILSNASVIATPPRPDLLGETYCVTPSPTHGCHHSYCQQCETLPFYLTEESVAKINKQMNVTLYFLNGTHSGNCSLIDNSLHPKLIRLTNQIQLVMIGESRSGVVVRCLRLSFYQIRNLRLEKLTMIDSRLHVLPTHSLNYFLSSVTIQLGSILFCGLRHANVSVQVQNSVFDSSDVKVDGNIYDNICTYLSSVGNTDHRTDLINNATTTCSSVIFSQCSFRNGTIIYMELANLVSTMNNCKLINYQVYALLNSTVVFTGNTMFTNSYQNSALLSFSSTVVLSGGVSFVNNTATKGGAMALYSSVLKIIKGAKVSFINNSAREIGGAIFIDPGFVLELVLMKLTSHVECFYQVVGDNGKVCILIFANNSATDGGNNVYGASLSRDFCLDCELEVDGSEVSSVSSDPTRVCVCDDSGVPQCRNNSFIFMTLEVYPGEKFTVSAVVVGGDYGPTIGTVHAKFLPVQSSALSLPSLRDRRMYYQRTNSSKHCTQLNYSLYHSAPNGIVLYLSTLYTDIQDLHHQHCINDEYCSHTTPVYFNITLLPCGPGFTLLGEPPVCDCYPELTGNGIQCRIVNKAEYFSWRSKVWMNVDGGGVIYNRYCPFDYCQTTSTELNLLLYPDSQCNNNRAGRLCGNCQDNYSLAIGSSRCILCSNNNSLSLIIFFVVAGFLLVFFISAVNLTVTQGMINGLVFYANIVWMYQSIFFPQDVEASALLVFLKVFIAWVNLDFGIESCFVDGLTAFWKTWLQFVFPFYIWAIAGLIIIATRYSTKLTNLLGTRVVSVLVTLILLSYMKLLRIASSALEFSFLVFTDNSNRYTLMVWSIDGNMAYFGLPHVFLFLAGLATLLFLWLPYTLVLFLVQWLRKLNHGRSTILFKWINRFHPVYDAYFAPLKHNHHYWFGILLLARGVVLITFASTFGIPDSVNLLLLLILTVALLVYMTLVQPYRSKVILGLQTSFLFNLTLLSGFTIFAYTRDNRSSLLAAAVGLSTGVAFVQFCGIVVCSVFARRRSCSLCRSKAKSHINVTEESVPAVVTTTTNSVSFRDSILEESQELLSKADQRTY